MFIGAWGEGNLFDDEDIEFAQMPDKLLFFKVFFLCMLFSQVCSCCLTFLFFFSLFSFLFLLSFSSRFFGAWDTRVARTLVPLASLASVPCLRFVF